MLQYIKRFTTTLNKLYIKVQYKLIHKEIDKFEKKYKVWKKHLTIYTNFDIMVIQGEGK